jgi:hypothetical protein
VGSQPKSADAIGAQDSILPHSSYDGGSGGAFMRSRREFIGNVAALAAGTLAVPARVIEANDRIRVGIIGPGARGMALVRQAMACPNTDFVAFADIFTKRLEDVAWRWRATGRDASCVGIR